MKKYHLKVTKREISGKKVKKLRKEGILPANIYGKDVKSTSVQVPFKDFETVFKEAGETAVVDLDLAGAKHPVLIHNVQHDSVTGLALHADFYQVNLKEKVKTMVPLVLTGEAKAATEKVGLVLQTLSEVEVEALPTDLPEKVEVDVTNLAAVNDQITIAQLSLPTGVTVLTDAAQVVVKVSELVSKEAEAQAAADAAAAEAAKTEGAPAEGEQPAEEKKEEAPGTPETPAAHSASSGQAKPQEEKK